MTTTGHRFQVVYADPPWPYRNRSSRGAATNHYDVVRPRDIRALGVNQIVDDDALLFLWATGPNWPMALTVIEAWGFTYVTIAFIWVKHSKAGVPLGGPGNYTRSNGELCLLGKRGRPRRISKSVKQILEETCAPEVMTSVPGEHSAKPPTVRDRIIELCGNVPRIELFARGPVPPGWHAWGDQAECAHRAPEALP